MTPISQLRTTLMVLAGTFLAATQAATLQKVAEDFGPNPRNVGFYLYVPATLAPSPPILVNPHWCHGSAQAAYAGSQYAALADVHGFIVIYPDSPNAADKCWDVSSTNATLRHDAGGDSLGIANMARWALARRVFVTGVSSGAMMTSVLVGAYPDLFAAGSAFAGVPFGCFAGEGYGAWSDDCAKGKITHTGAEWAEMVRAAYPGYGDGWRPKMQIFHGTDDEVLSYVNFGEEVKQWTSVLGLDETPASVTADTPVSGWTKYVYGSTGWFEAYSAAGVSHNIQNKEAVVMKWFDLACTTGDCFKWGKGSPRRRPGRAH
ncbi:carbohydrate esterase family 1 protein [Apiospora kogelbergensis]|uniref:Carbohydrate esterase family 1 protein n=1 Tax=Apiospora kogelbergensis TaxID=1337665 RepID=A0AAW0R228_9PEZI